MTRDPWLDTFHAYRKPEPSNGPSFTRVAVCAAVAWPLLIGGCWALAVALDAIKFGA